ncbi:MAG: HAMP domain-containing protein [Deltaproteobacteria bacterium]|nr:HAMP domain-containing protein [Deltaproteobacteria bacterium]
MHKHSLAMTTQLAGNAAFYASDKAGAQALAERTRDQADDVAYVLMRDAKGEILADASLPDLGRLHAELPLPTVEKATADEPVVLGSIEVLPVTAPILSAGVSNAAGDGATASPRIGSVQIGFRTGPLDQAIRDVGLRAAAVALAALACALVVAILLSRRLVRRIERLAAAAAGIEAGDLTYAVETSGSDELGELARAFGGMSGGLRTLVSDLRAAAGEVEREATSILTTSTQQSAMASQQASAINETSTTVTEIAQTSKQATEHADSVIKVAQRSEDLSREGQRVVDEAMSGMEKMAEQVKAIATAIADLRERTLQIGDIISTVRDLAEQSNLLALNASIEAAKAGEHGRGFAVVAMEMRNLAEQSKGAAGQVRGILSEVQKGTRVAVAATEEGSKRAHAAIALAQSAGSTIQGLAEVIRDSSLAARQIASNTRQQTIGVEQIVSAITELSSAMNDALEGTKRIEAVAGNLTTVSKRLTEIVGRYQA